MHVSREREHKERSHRNQLDIYHRFHLDWLQDYARIHHIDPQQLHAHIRATSKAPLPERIGKEREKHA